MPALPFSFSHGFFLIKAGGAVALMTYFLATRFYFDVPMFLLGALLMVGAILFYGWTTAIFQRGSPEPAPAAMGHAAEPWLFATEDGLLLLPLTFLGINVFTSLAATILFTSLMLVRHPRNLALALGTGYFMVVLWVLPFGIWMVVAAHALAEITIRYVFQRRPVAIHRNA